MKKFAAIMLILLTSPAAYALPLGNPSEASLFINGAWCESTCCDPCDPCFSWCDAWNFRIGFYGDYVFNRHMEVYHHHGGDHLGDDIEETKLYTNAGYIALNFCDRIDLFATLGASDLLIRTEGSAWDPVNSINGEFSRSKLDFVTHFSWSVGGRATLWECGCFAVGLEAQYFRFNPELNYFLDYESGAFTYLTRSEKPTYREWQVGLGAAYRVATSCQAMAMVPYMGVTWSRAHLDMNKLMFEHTSTSIQYTLNDLRSKKPWGYAIGMSLTLCDIIGVTVEGHFASEKALYVNGQFRF